MQILWIVTAFTGLVFSAISLSGAPEGQERREQGNLVIEGVPRIPQALTDRLQQYANVRSSFLADWLPDGSGLLIYTRFGETTQVHRLRQPLGMREQITFFAEPPRSVQMLDSGGFDGFVFRKDNGGDEQYQGYFYDLKTATWRLLTDGESRNGGMVLANEEPLAAYFSTRRTGRNWDIYLHNLKTGAEEMILSADGFFSPIEFSHCDTKLLVRQSVSSNESYLHRLDLETGEFSPIHPHANLDYPVYYGSVTIDAEGDGLYYTTDALSEFTQLYHFDFESGAVTPLTENIDWNAGSLVLSPDGGRLVFTINAGGYEHLYQLDTATNTLEKIEVASHGQIYGMAFSPDGQQLAMAMELPTRPTDIYTLDLADQSLTRWTQSEIGGLNAEEFKSPELIHYPTFDEVDGQPRKIPSFFYKPEGEGPFPVLVTIHGGPAAQSRADFTSTFQLYLNELGIAVLDPNVRGSSGYGKTYLKLDDWKLREDSVRDIGALLDWIAEQPELDENRVMVMGGSYGGYMVLASLVHYSNRLVGGINVVGISNFVTFLTNTKDYRRDLRRVEYGDERIPEMREFLLSISPTENAEKITKPLFVIQGLNDPRVPASESEQMVAEIRENGGIVWYLLANDEGHGFRKKTNRDFYRASVVLFIEQFLLGKTD